MSQPEVEELAEFEQTYLEKFDDLAELSDSSVESEGNLLRLGNIPYEEWYEKELHDGYDIDGQKVTVRGQGDNIDKFLLSRNKNELKRRIYDAGNDKIMRINDRDLSIINRIRKGKCATKMFDFPIPDTHVFDITTSGIRPKTSFTISRYDYKKILKHVDAIKKGTLKVDKYGEVKNKNQKKNEMLKRMDPYRATNSKHYDVWTKKGLVFQSRQILNAPKCRKPTTYESYNPPSEFLSGEGGIKYQCLRVVPQYNRFIHHRFERCLDLYLLPRKVQKKTMTNPAHLLPRLDSVEDLRPFPEILTREFLGHARSVMCIDISACGQWLVSGADDGTVRIFEVDTGRQYYCHSFGKLNRIESVQFNPHFNKQSLLTVVCKHRCFVIPISFLQSSSSYEKFVIQPIKKIKSSKDPNLVIPKLNLKETLALFKQSLFEELSHWPLLIERMKTEMNCVVSQTLQEIAQQIAENNKNVEKNGKNEEEEEEEGEKEKIEQNTDDISMAARWSFLTFHSNKKNTIIGNYELINNNVICISFLNFLNGVKWHHRGEYFCTWSSGAGGGDKRASLIIHKLSKFESVLPFSKSIGDISDIEWHPRRPRIYVACKQSIRCFDLAKCKLQEKYAVTTNWISCLSLHRSGLNMIVGGMDGHVGWYDMDLSHSPYKTFKYHVSGPGSHCVRNVMFHRDRKFNLWASCGDDGKIYIFYCKMFRTKFQDPILLPLKIIQIRKHRFLDLIWHNTQPWIFAACSDGVTRLYTAL